jgi:hypothetical protein
MIVDILRNKISSLLDILLLNNNGAFSSFSNLHNTNVLLDKKKHHYSAKCSCSANRQKYLEIINKIKQLDVFAYKVDNVELKTVVHKTNKIVQEDDLVAITTSAINDILFTTSYEKIAVLEETRNTFILCMTTCSENVVNGYYTFKLKYDDDKQKINIKYSKVQSYTTLQSRLIKQINANSDIEEGKKSIINTINYLLNDNKLLTKDVKYEYK